jgi:hypothetical protein
MGSPRTFAELAMQVPNAARCIRVVNTVLADGLATTTSNPWTIDELNLYHGPGS